MAKRSPWPSPAVYTSLSSMLAIPPVSTHDRRGPPRMAPNLAPSQRAASDVVAETLDPATTHMRRGTSGWRHRMPERATKGQSEVVPSARLGSSDKEVSQVEKSDHHHDPSDNGAQQSRYAGWPLPRTVGTKTEPARD